MEDLRGEVVDDGVGFFGRQVDETAFGDEEGWEGRVDMVESSGAGLRGVEGVEVAEVDGVDVVVGTVQFGVSG